MHTYFCSKCYKNFKLKLIDNKTGKVSVGQVNPSICPYCGNKKVVLLSRVK